MVDNAVQHLGCIIFSDLRETGERGRSGAGGGVVVRRDEGGEVVLHGEVRRCKVRNSYYIFETKERSVFR